MVRATDLHSFKNLLEFIGHVCIIFVYKKQSVKIKKTDIYLRDFLNIPKSNIYMIRMVSLSL